MSDSQKGDWEEEDEKERREEEEEQQEKKWKKKEEEKEEEVEEEEATPVPTMGCFVAMCSSYTSPCMYIGSNCSLF